jgi:hypothetical protein
MRLVRFENTTSGDAISVNPLQIAKVDQNKKKTDTTFIWVIGPMARSGFTVNYDYKTTCDMIDDALKA